MSGSQTYQPTHIIIMTPAVALALLHGLLVTVALSGKASWDEVVGDKQAFLMSAHLFLQLLKCKNGKTWWCKGPALGLPLVDDASDHAFAAFSPSGELWPGPTSSRFRRMPHTSCKTGGSSTKPTASHAFCVVGMKGKPDCFR